MTVAVIFKCGQRVNLKNIIVIISTSESYGPAKFRSTTVLFLGRTNDYCANMQFDHNNPSRNSQSVLQLAFLGSMYDLKVVPFGKDLFMIETIELIFVQHPYNLSKI